mmetsp:Transcript_13246/g.43177  ORF Transcript_13246/g.43177 Transcript_13246/m.43177 type:complete len:266 (+) Transcript_13246:31-828(+)
MLRRWALSSSTRVPTTRGLSSSTTATVRDEWGDAAFAREWTLGGGVDRTNPDRQRFQAMLGSLVKRRLGAPSAGAGVLDLGCGSGLSAKAVAAANEGSLSRLVGVDGSAAMLDLAKDVCPSMATAQVTFGEALSLEAEGLLFGGGPFRAVVCSQVLHELPAAAKTAAVALARNVLPSGGCFYVQDRFRTEVTPGVPADDYHAIWDVITIDRPDTMPWPDYAKYIDDKLDDATTEPQCLALLKDHFDDVEVLYRVFNRSLIVARVH